jgi:hypothetical protein
MGTFRLGVDFGTSTTAAVLRWPDGAVRPLLFDGSELLPSAVCRGDDGTLLAGRDALHAGRASPQALELNPKRCIDDGSVLLGTAEVSVTELVAAVLVRVADESRRVAGAVPETTVLTCPVGWGVRRRQILVAASETAGLGPTVLASEPLAAAYHFLASPGSALPVGGHLLVYDLGAGTFDAAVVRRTVRGFEVVAERGLCDAGGLDIDAAAIQHLGRVYSVRDPQRWERLARPATDPDRRAHAQLRDDVRVAKEMLSRTASTTIPLPLFDDNAVLTREELERLALPILARTVRTSREALTAAKLTTDQLTAVLLVGGASRTPLAATLLHRDLGIAPTVMHRPELVVAEGSLHAPPEPLSPPVEMSPLTGPAGAGPLSPPDMAPDPPLPTSPEDGGEVEGRVDDDPVDDGGTTEGTASQREPVEAVDGPVQGDAAGGRPGKAALPSRRRIGSVLAGLLVTVLLAAAAGWWQWREGGREPAGGSLPSPSTSASPSATASPSPAVAESVPLEGQPWGAWALTFSPDGKVVVASGQDGKVRFWDVGSGALVRTIDVEGRPVPSELAYRADGGALAVAALDGSNYVIQGWDLGTGRPQWTVATPGTVPLHLMYSPDGRRIASVEPDSRIRLRNADTGAVTQTIQTAHSQVATATFTSDGRTLVAASNVPTPRNGPPGAAAVQIWDLATGTQTGRLDGYNGVAVSPDGRTLTLTTPVGGVSAYDLGTGAITALGGDRTTASNRLAFVSDTQFIAYDAGSGLVVWDIPTRRQSARFSDLAGADGSALFAAATTTRCVVTGGYGRALKLWTVASGN